MKVRLLKRLRHKGRNQISIISWTSEKGMVTGMTVRYDDDKYRNLFSFGDTKEDALRKAEHIYIQDFIDQKNRK